MIVCWQCSRVIAPGKQERPKDAPTGTTVTKVVTCHVCKISYKVTVEKL